MPHPVSQQMEVPSQHNWRTTDQDEINRRRARAQTGVLSVHGSEAAGPKQRNLSKATSVCDALEFTAAARQKLKGALIRCEERYPNEGHHSVLYVVVEKNAELYRPQLNGLHEQYFGPGQSDPLAPVRLEVVDRATDEALQRLVEAGLLTKTSRASRPLFSVHGLEPGPAPLSAAELERLSSHKQLAARKLKMARVVADAGLEEDARTPLLDAVLASSRAFAVEQRLPEPSLIHEALLPPLSPCWKEALPLLRDFSIDAGQPCRPVLEAMAGFVADAQTAHCA